MRRLAGFLVLLLALAAAAGCSGGSDAAGPATTSADSGDPITFVTMGSSETSGERLPDPLRSAWSQLLYRSAFPRRAVYVNLASSRSSVADGLAQQLPAAIALHPTVATIWFGVSDAFAATPVDSFGADLTTMVEGLEAAGTRVIVVLGPGPPDGDVDPTAYTDRAEQVAEAADADVVDLREAEVRSVSSQQAVADAVAEVLGPIT